MKTLGKIKQKSKTRQNQSIKEKETKKKVDKNLNDKQSE